MDNREIANRVLELTLEITRLDIYEWRYLDLFTWQWWLLLTILILPWIVFIKMVDKKHLPETLLFGSWVMIISETFDHIGYELGMWTYLVEIFPLFPRFEEVNFSVLPVTYMLIYQTYKDWKEYLIVIAIAAGTFTWIGEPILIWLELYVPLKWVPAYGFPIYVALGLITKWGTQKIYSLAKTEVKQ
ncbi:CBO0543 family protein [Pelosinus baikalensis]|uniref:Uncharacterized protein n=1 Tax=Pelosinus baikalensis TaxID=2892015 RepID=A0ABS8HXQ0_9FIRM|nr:CBO0543 family protein [Pelosinus baikalensis]MCC5467944.1 hypothetical protein [Pelosinus baikalensis]